MRTLAPVLTAGALVPALIAVAACGDPLRTPTEPVALLASAGDGAALDADAATLGPADGDRVLFDARTSLQAAASDRAAFALWGLGYQPRYWDFTRDMDGIGTNALRVEWPAGGKSCDDVAPSLSTELAAPLPRRLYVQWKQRMGRTPTGGGNGALGVFALTNAACPREGRVLALLTRQAGSADDRVELRWLGPPPVTSHLKVKGRSIAIPPTEGWSFLPQEHVGEVLEHTLYAQAESGPGASDGVLRLWVNGRLLAERTGLALGERAFRRFHFPWTMAAPHKSQTEYFWDIVAWRSPVASLTLAPTLADLDVDDTLRLAVTARDAIGSPAGGEPVAFASSDETVAKALPDGRVAVVGSGEATITATVEGKSAEMRVLARAKNEFFVSPTGTPDARGSRGKPMDLITVLAGADGRIGPGSVIWLRGGTYRGVFESDLVGSPEAPILLRAAPGERATIDGQLTVEGSDITIWGLELMQSVALEGRRSTLFAKAPGARYINLIIHDSGENGVSFRTETGFSELYGSIVYNNGNDEHLDQGVYAPNDAGEKWITDNVFFNNMASGIQVYGTPDHPLLTNVRVEGNISFNNSSIASAVSEENVTVGGATVTEKVSILGNFLYYAGEAGQNLRFGLEGKQNLDVVVRDNYVVGGSTVVRSEDFATAVVENNTFVGTRRMARLGGASLAGHRWAGNVYHRDPSARAWNWNGDAYTFDDFRAATGIGATDVAVAEMPTTPKVFVRPNRYERGRAHIGVVNWGRAPSVAVDVSGVLQAGDRWELRNVQDVFGPPVASGVYAGGTIDVPLTGVEPPVAEGRPGRPKRTAPDFDAFLLTVSPSAR